MQGQLSGLPYLLADGDGYADASGDRTFQYSMILCEVYDALRLRSLKIVHLFITVNLRKFTLITYDLSKN
ncbi:MAG: hypothetical protein V7K21_12220 [Nostoc sp.]|uniref:hypothetical protein n=1 Tax=Nostoc sp. TaxID=1180 RepID=UPI002FF6EEE3